MKNLGKVWIFDNDVIKQVDCIECTGHKVLIDLESSSPYGFPKSWPYNKPHFGTREELCDYYKQIFK